jgi:hypothetical protein
LGIVAPSTSKASEAVNTAQKEHATA